MKRILIVKNTQLRKTWEMIRWICSHTSEEEDLRIINLILCGKKLDLVSQTKSRLQKEIGKKSNEDKLVIVQNEDLPKEKLIELSSKSDCTNVCEVIDYIIHEDINNVLMCSHPKRHKDIAKLIKRITSKKYTQTFQINIWIDEADINIPRTFEKNLKNLESKINTLNLITATPEKLFKIENWEEYQKFDLDFPYDEKIYTRFRENDIRIEEEQFDSMKKYIKNIFNKHGDSIFKNNDLILIPAKRAQKSHNKVRKLCQKLGCNVLVNNGHGHILYHKDGKFNIKKFLNKEDLNKGLNHELISFFKSDKGRHYKNNPFVITGHICIGRGITYCSSSFNFDKGTYTGDKFWINRMIIHDTIVGNSNEAYQFAGRVTNTLKTKRDWEPTIVHCSQKFLNNVNKHEKKLINYQKSSLKFVNKGTWKMFGTNKTIRVEIYKKDMETYIYDSYDKLKSDIWMINEYEKLERKFKLKTENSLTGVHKRATDGDFIGFVKRGAPYCKVWDLTELRTSVNGIKSIYHFTGKDEDEYVFKTGQKFAKLYICYENLKNKKDTQIKFIVCIATIQVTKLYDDEE